MLLTNLVCHLVGVSSACTNPVLYGLLNCNIRREYGLLLLQLRKVLNIFKSKDSRSETIQLNCQ